MKLIHTGYNLELELCENQVTVLVVENPKAYTKILGDIWSQTQGGEGDFILSDGEKIKNMSKEVECIYNPFAVDCNDKKIISKLYQEMKTQGDSCLAYEGSALNGAIITYLESLAEIIPYAVEYNVDFDVVNLLKMYGVKIATDAESLLEKVVEYLKTMHRICNIESFIFVGLKDYFSVNELQHLYEFVFYEKINMLIVEASQKARIDDEKCWLLDSDLCIIDLN